MSLPDRERRLRTVLEPLRERFDYVFIDTPPSLGLLTLNALVAADAVLIPLNCEYFALEGLADLVATLRRVRAALNPVARHRRRAADDVRRADEPRPAGRARHPRVLQGARLHTVIPRNIRLGEAPSHGMPAILYDVEVARRRSVRRARRASSSRATPPPRADSTEPHHG